MPNQEGAVVDLVDSRCMNEAVEFDLVLEQEKRLERVEGILTGWRSLWRTGWRT